MGKFLIGLLSLPFMAVGFVIGFAYIGCLAGWRLLHDALGATMGDL